MTRTSIMLGAVALAAALLLEPAASTAVGAVSGMGLKMWGACILCAGSGAVIAMGGWGSILVAAASSNSLGIAGACVGACVAAFL